MKALLTAVIAVCALLPIWPGAAAAQEEAEQEGAAASPPTASCETPTPEVVEQAKQLHATAIQALETEQYMEAIVAWQQAYQLDCTRPKLLINLAVAYEKAGMYKEAMKYALQCVQALQKPVAPEDAAERATMVEELRIKLEELRVRLQEQLYAEALAAAQAKARADAKPCPPAPAPEVVVASQSPYADVPLYVALGGAAVGLVGVAGYIEAQRSMVDADERCGLRSACADPTALKDGSSAQDRANIFGPMAIIGGIVSAGGIAFYLFDPFGLQDTNEDEAGVRVSPTVSSQSVGFQATGRF